MLNELLDKEYTDTANETMYMIEVIEQNTKQLANIEALLQQVKTNLEQTDGMPRHHKLGVEVEVKALLQAARATAYKGQEEILTDTWTHGNLRSLQTLTSSIMLLIRDALQTKPKVSVEELPKEEKEPDPATIPQLFASSKPYSPV